MEYGGDAPLDLLVSQYAEAHGMYEDDVLNRDGSLYWMALWRERKQAEIDHRNRG